MERLTIDGGEVWLGFARNRVKALKRAGIRYTRQVFEMPDGAKVIVELAGKDHTIRLHSAPPCSVISGVVRGGEIKQRPIPDSDRTKKTLSEFKPTADAAKKVFKKTEMATQFGEVKELATRLTDKKQFPNPDNLDSQPGVISAGLYSGLMCKVIQILLGLENQIKITYTYDFYDSYGVYKDKNTKMWLIRISKDFGVLAMPLGLRKVSIDDKTTDAVKECHKVFDGVPTGRDFPRDVEQAVKQNKILQLATKEQIKEFYELDPYFLECGWSFNKDGSEAHNTGHKVVNDYSNSFHYRMTIDITEDGKKYSGQANINKVSSGVICWTDFDNSKGEVDFDDPDYTYGVGGIRQYPFMYFASRSLKGNQGNVYNIIDIVDKPKQTFEVVEEVTVYVGHNAEGELFKIGYKATKSLGEWAGKKRDYSRNIYFRRKLKTEDIPWPFFSGSSASYYGPGWHWFPRYMGYNWNGSMENLFYWPSPPFRYEWTGQHQMSLKPSPDYTHYLTNYTSLIRVLSVQEVDVTYGIPANHRHRLVCYKYDPPSEWRLGEVYWKQNIAETSRRYELVLNGEVCKLETEVPINKRPSLREVHVYGDAKVWYYTEPETYKTLDYPDETMAVNIVGIRDGYFISSIRHSVREFRIDWKEWAPVAYDGHTHLWNEHWEGKRVVKVVKGLDGGNDIVVVDGRSTSLWHPEEKRYYGDEFKPGRTEEKVEPPVVEIIVEPKGLVSDLEYEDLEIKYHMSQYEPKFIPEITGVVDHFKGTASFSGMMLNHGDVRGPTTRRGAIFQDIDPDKYINLVGYIGDE